MLVPRDEFLKQSMVMFSATIIGSALNYIYQVYVGRALGPEGYGAFGSLFAIFYLISIFSGTVQAGSARFVSKFNATGEVDAIGAFLYSLIKKSIILGISGFILFVLISPWVAEFLKLGSNAGVIMLGTVILFTFLSPATLGGLQGLQRFYTMSFITILTYSAKLSIAILLLSLGYGMLGALGALTIATAIGFLYSLLPLMPYLKKGRSFGGFNFKELYAYSMPTILIMVCLAIPSNFDVILAKHFFSSYEAGLYTASSVIGKIILFLPGAISAVMFPKASVMKTLGKNTSSLLNRSLIYTGLLSGSAAMAFIIFPGLTGLIFGPTYLEASSIARFYVAMMFLFSLTVVVAQYCLATNNLSYTYLIVIFTGLEMILISFFHQSTMQMVQVLVAANLLLFLVSYIYTMRLASRFPHPV